MVLLKKSKVFHFHTKSGKSRVIRVHVKPQAIKVKENGDNPASLLLVRKAGPKQPVQAEFALSDYEQSLPANQLKIFILYKWQRFRRCDCRWY